MESIGSFEMIAFGEREMPGHCADDLVPAEFHGNPTGEPEPLAPVDRDAAAPRIGGVDGLEPGLRRGRLGGNADGLSHRMGGA